MLCDIVGASLLQLVGRVCFLVFGFFFFWRRLDFRPVRNLYGKME
jgi:hypothetical protein